MTTLSLTDILSLSPLLILLFGSLLFLLLECFLPHLAKKVNVALALILLAVGAIAAIYAPSSTQPILTNWLKFDSLARFFTVLFMLMGMATISLAIPFFKRFRVQKSEFLFLIFGALFGLLLTSNAADFLTLFLGIETLSLSLYVLCCYIKKSGDAREAATKYFLTGALAICFLLYGFALVYGATGTTNLDALLAKYQSLQSQTEIALFLGGTALITLGLAFKAAVVPAHAWAPDVYDGAPTPVTAFMSVATKAGALAAFIRIFSNALPDFSPYWNQSVSFLIYPTLIYANLVALFQTKLRRFFAYSSIANAGFMLIPLAAGGADSKSSLLFYLVVYSLATLACFAIIAFLDDKEESATFSDMKGLYSRAPILALFFAFALLTLAGIPPTAGFLAKFYLFKTAFQAKAYGLVIVGLLTTILSAFYYLRLAALLFIPNSTKAKFEYSIPAFAVSVFCVSLLTLLAFYPDPFLQFIAKI